MRTWRRKEKAMERMDEGREKGREEGREGGMKQCKKLEREREERETDG